MNNNIVIARRRVGWLNQPLYRSALQRSFHIVSQYDPSLMLIESQSRLLSREFMIIGRERSVIAVHNIAESLIKRHIYQQKEIHGMHA
jgi:hypothetical protein